MLAYHVCECTRSVPAQASAIARSTPRVRSAAFAEDSSARSAYDDVSGSSRGAPNACTRASTSERARNARTSSATCTPAPPYTSGGYSLLSTSTRMLGNYRCRARPDTASATAETAVPKSGR